MIGVARWLQDSAMDGMHDLGGKQGFGKIAYPPRAA